MEHIVTSCAGRIFFKLLLYREHLTKKKVDEPFLRIWIVKKRTNYRLACPTRKMVTRKELKATSS